MAMAMSVLGWGACLPTSPGGELLPDGGKVPPRIDGYLRSAPFSKLVLEVDLVAGQAPRATAESDVVALLGQVISKPGGITATHDETIPSKGADHAWTFAELDALAKERFNLTVPGDTTKIHVMFVDGHSAEDGSGGKILGLAWNQRHIALFKKTLEETCSSGLNGPFASTLCPRAERAVWMHEVGHVLGLVDNGLSMVAPHKDPDHGAHDVSDQCVMFWAYEGEALLDVFRQRLTSGGDTQPGFDAECLKDIAAVRDAP
jgi:hypothetical protein